MNIYIPYKEKAIALRKQGKTFREISNELPVKVSKSTLSAWCQNIEMPPWYQEKVDRLNRASIRKARVVSMVMQEKLREDLIRTLRKDNTFFSSFRYDKDILKLILAILYLGEGGKLRARSGLLLGSSESDIIKLYIKLLNLCYKIKPETLKCRICYRADQDIESLEKYWSLTTQIPRKNFYKTKPDPRTFGKPTRNTDYKGVCVIMCGHTNIQRELDIIPKIILESLDDGPIA